MFKQLTRFLFLLTLFVCSTRTMEFGTEFEKIAPGTVLQNKFEVLKSKMKKFMIEVKNFYRSQNPEGWVAWASSKLTFPTTTEQELKMKAQKLFKELAQFGDEMTNVKIKSHSDPGILGSLHWKKNLIYMGEFERQLGMYGIFFD